MSILGRSARALGATLAATDAIGRAVGSPLRLHGWALGRLLRAAWGEMPPPRPLPRWVGRLATLPVIGRLFQRRAPTLAGLWRAWAVYVVTGTAAACTAVLAVPAGVWGAVLGGAGVAVATAALAARAGIAHWQLRHGRPGDWAEWWRDGALVPPSPGGGEGRGLASLLVLFAAGAALLPAAALAAGVAVGVTPDPALRAIELLYPTATATPLTRMVSAMIGLMTLAGCASLAYGTIVAVNVAAARGESPLTADAEHGGAWAVVRVALALALLIPATPSGLSGGHVAYAHVATWSSNIASALWAGFAADVLGVREDGTDAAQAATGSLGIPSPVGGLTLAQQILESETCHAYSRRERLRGANVPTVVAPLARPEAAAGHYVWTWGHCGALTLPAAPAGAPAALTAFRAARMEAVGALVEAIRATDLADRVAGGGMAGSGMSWPSDRLLDQLAGPAAAYDAAAQTAAGTYLATRQQSSRREAVEAARTQGWTAAGSLWRTLAAASGEAVTLASEAPARRDPDHRFFEGLVRHSNKGEGWLYISDKLHKQLTEESRVPTLTADALAAPGDESAGLLARMANPITRPLATALTRWAQSSDADPVKESMSLGHWLVGASDAGWIAGGAVALAAGNGFSSLAGADAAFRWFSGKVQPYLWWMYAIGIIHAYVLPMIPFIVVVFAGVNWLISLAEMLLALPLLALLAARLDGRELLHAALKPGLILVANTVVLPVYTVAALASTYYLLPVGLQMVNGTFTAAYIGSQGGFTLSLGGILAGLTLMLWLHWQVTVRILGVVHEIPNRLLRYWGSRDEIADGKASGAVVGAALGAGGGGGRSSGGGGGGGGGRSGGGGLGIRPAGGGGGASQISASGAARAGETAGNDGATGWHRQSGGYAALSADDQAAADDAYARWAERRADEGKDPEWSVEEYTNYVQGRAGQRRERGGDAV